LIPVQSIFVEQPATDVADALGVSIVDLLRAQIQPEFVKNRDSDNVVYKKSNTARKLYIYSY
jgi:hypothetical protein